MNLPSVPRTLAAVFGLLLICNLAGCAGRSFFDFGGPQGTVQVRSFGEDAVRVESRLGFGIYTQREQVEHTFILSDVPLDQLVSGEVRSGQIVHIEFLWTPRPGSTPVEATGVNTSVRYILISEGELGIYSGAGFAMVRGQLDSDQVTIDVRDASLRLTDQTDGFVDLLTPARLTATMGAQRDDRLTLQMHYALSQFVTDKLGVSRFVHHMERLDRPNEHGQSLHPEMPELATAIGAIQ
ncbi:MAG: hypothetical protein EA377_02445 [Phycisphaerales bacterium]|nr:MAG: hypothetical protein EA377_02445 [Phycisphaerales bacterium]